MGDAYNALGQPYAAALCYAGMLPEAMSVTGSDIDSAGIPVSAPSKTQNKN